MPKHGDDICPICGLGGALLRKFDLFKYSCPRCGEFAVEMALALSWQHARSENALSDSDRSLLPYLSAYTRTHPHTPLDDGNWRRFAQAKAGCSVSTKTRMLLELIAERSRTPGGKGGFKSSEDYPLIAAAGYAEADHLMAHLKETGLVNKEVGADSVKFPANDRVHEVVPAFSLTVKGWEAIEPLHAAGLPGTCFVAMSYAKSLDEAYEAGMVPAIETDCGLRVLRVDRVEHNDDVNDRILAEIRRAQCIVADFTEHRAGVYFEAGFALGLGKTVIWTCRSDHLANAHFDTRQYSHIEWSTPEDLRTKLTARLRATVALPALMS